jgi:hypothetical protein
MTMFQLPLGGRFGRRRIKSSERFRRNSGRLGTANADRWPIL